MYRAKQIPTLSWKKLKNSEPAVEATGLNFLNLLFSVLKVDGNFKHIIGTYYV